VTQVTWASDRGGAGAAAGTTAWSVASVALEMGVNVITVTAKDAAGHAATDVLTVTRTDGTAPTVSINVTGRRKQLRDGRTRASRSPARRPTTSASRGVTWSNNKGGDGTAVGTSNWSWQAIALKPGTNVITLTAKDAAGNVATDVLTVTLTDAVAPEVAITSPARDHADDHRGEHRTRGTASDLFGVTDVRWSNDRGGAGLASGTTSWSVPALPLQPRRQRGHRDGERRGRPHDVGSCLDTSDGKAPTMSLAAPAANTVTKAETINLSGSASDDSDRRGG
jgi:hypothetical protein